MVHFYYGSMHFFRSLNYDSKKILPKNVFKKKFKSITAEELTASCVCFLGGKKMLE